MRTADFHYDLPPAAIAQHPAPQRDQSRLLVLRRPTRTWSHARFTALGRFLRDGDVLVLNDSRVIPARLRAAKAGSGGQIELLLVAENAANDWWALIRPGRRVQVGTRLVLLDATRQPTTLTATIEAKSEDGRCRVRFDGVPEVHPVLERIGEVPLPPYIEREAGPEAADRERYQTVYAAAPGSVAAPTAGLHFTPELIEALQREGVRVCRVTLHVGLGTFAPVKTEDLAQHQMHEERYALSEETVTAIARARAAGGRVVAVGTTTVRVLESNAARHGGALCAERASTRLFVHPPWRFQVVDALLTNFHLPRSTLLMLVSAFAAPGETHGRDLVLAAYADAVREGYRFFSYGDAMLLL